MCLKGCPNKNSIFLFPLFAVPPGRAQHLLPEVCAVDASGTLPGAPTARLFRERRRRRHEGNLRLHGWPVSCCWGGGVTESARAAAAANTITIFHLSRRKFYKKFGQQAWLVAAITVTEFLIVVKYDPHTITLPIPFFIMQCWFLGLVLIVFWTVWRFFFR